MSLTELNLNIPPEHIANVFGQFDAYIKKIEKTFHVTVVNRNESIKILGSSNQTRDAANVFEQLLELSKRGNTITEQNVNYAISLALEKNTSSIVEIDKECICHTVQGKPVKPKTLGQKSYVDNIRGKMIVFGTGPAGTGKTYLAIAMAVTAFKNEEVGRIILTRPAIEAGEKLGFLPGDLQSKIDPYLRPLYDALYQIMGADGKRADRSGPPCLHEGSHLRQCLYYLRRGPKYHPGPDENVPHPNRLWIQSGDNRGRHPKRPGPRHKIRLGRGLAGA